MPEEINPARQGAKAQERRKGERTELGALAWDIRVYPSGLMLVMAREFGMNWLSTVWVIPVRVGAVHFGLTGFSTFAANGNCSFARTLVIIFFVGDPVVLADVDRQRYRVGLYRCCYVVGMGPDDNLYHTSEDMLPSIVGAMRGTVNFLQEFDS
ncbi:hypothetical protein VN12_16245 [Pirellula sp. SH-Sr6A]|nr:hypothetical protein VN12_16245 [Pirellula sp. SH-Sr6A]